MPVHFKIASHGANPVRNFLQGLKSDEDLLLNTWGIKGNGTNKIGELLQSSFKLDQDFSGIISRNNGLVDTVIEAYNNHHHLVIRPDDVWIAILGQFNFYVNAHAEELRSHFVSHKDKKKLTVKAVGTRYTVDFGNIAKQFTEKIHENVVDKDLKDWILPDFTTTTNNDTVVAAVLMMATLKAYFEYVCTLCCGLPSVTLEGTKNDWVKILKRIEKLETFGDEPKAWAGLLRPIIKRFIRAFDGERDMEFWNRICYHQPVGSGTTYISGWLTAFCVWSCKGEWKVDWESPFGHGHPFPFKDATGYDQLVLDGAGYPAIDLDNIPVGFCEVDVDLDDNGEHFDCMMVSGHMASLTEGENKDILRPQPAWFMFIKYNNMPPDGSAGAGASRRRREAANPATSIAENTDRVSAMTTTSNVDNDENKDSVASKTNPWKKKISSVWGKLNARK